MTFFFLYLLNFYAPSFSTKSYAFTLKFFYKNFSKLWVKWLKKNYQISISHFIEFFFKKLALHGFDLGVRRN